MSGTDLSQNDADRLRALPKRRMDNKVYQFPAMGEKIEIPLVSMDQTEEFQLNINRSSIKLLKVTYQTRTQRTYILARLDLDGPPHRNPDGVIVECPHLHVYREGFGDKWAVPVEASRFSDTTNIHRTYEDFLAFCNISDPPNMQFGLN